MFVPALLLSLSLSVMPLAQAKPGQQGYCLTEWTGGEKIKIPVEVVGTLMTTQPGRRAVLVRLLDERFRDSGVVAGMSGSPVYVEEKLLGAVAFGWSFAREPLAGVTPFEDMQVIPYNPMATPRSRLSSPESSALVGGEGVGVNVQPLFAALRGQLPPAAFSPKVEPSSSTPLAVAGVPLSPWTEGLWRTLGLTPVPSAYGAPTPSAPPEPGDTVAAALIWGDAVVAAGGTLTARDEGRFFAFGHPLIAAGAVRMPALRGRVLAVHNSFSVPFKIFTVGEAFGTFVADQPAGMVALAGPPPRGLPLSIAVQGEGTWRGFAFFLADVPILQPLLAAFLTAASASHNQGSNDDVTVDLALTARFANGSTLALRQNTAGSDAVARVATFVGALLALLTTPPFPVPALEGLELQLQRLPHESASLVEAIPQRRKVRPGETLPVTVALQPRFGPRQTQVYTLPIPAHLAPGKVDLLVADGSAFSEYALRSERTAPQDFLQLLGQLSRLEPSSHLVLALELREPGLALSAGAMPALPPSLAASLSASLAPGNVQRLASTLFVGHRVPLAWPLSGAVRVGLEVVPQEGL
ncbi:MAG: hypothetical protein NZ869_09190 [Thermoanaerobaculum sp.]|nr:hypothetical protein [Thermoanaerobaculum sp.]MDW7967440.1 SpoIVB peptidase S55 domain-containing protein [Thermoanaerobaculum sp.]